MKIIQLIIIISIAFSQLAYSCDAEEKVIDCDKGSEHTWNPSNVNTTQQLNRFYELDKLINQQYELKDFISATKLIEEYLALSNIYKNNWNYGNAVHDGNRILGLISYQQGKIDEAASYLIEAGKSSGSPQLDSFGPELDLANLLLKKGRDKEVKTYLLGIKTFWDMDNGAVDEWIAEIDKGENPELNRFGNFRMTLAQKIIFGLGMLWPVLVTVGLFFAIRNRDLSPWKYIPVAIISGYTVMFIGSLISNASTLVVIEILPNTLITPSIYAMTAISQLAIPFLAIYWLSKSGRMLKASDDS